MPVLDLEAKLSLNDKEYNEGLGQAEQKAKSGLGSALKTAGKVGAAAIAAATSAAVAFGAESVKVGADFDKSMSQVAATMGLTVDEIGDLREFAMDMGSSTSFSAIQAADALNYMALAGYDAETSMGMLPTVLSLAAAGGMDLAQASDMVTDSQSALGLSLEETEAMVDMMAKTSSKSNTSVAQLGEAFLTIGATARNVNGGVQELSTLLGVLADNGIKGAEGGTHMRNVLLSLQEASEDGAIAVGDMSIAVYGADGSMRSIVDIIGDMQGALDGMDQASKDAIIGGIFNKPDLAAVNALLGTSSDRFAELSAEIGDATGAAQAMADTQLDNLAGDITLFQSALEGAKIVVSDQLTPTIREFVQFGTEGLSQLTAAFQEGGLSGAMEALGDILSEAITKIIEFIPQMIDAGIQLLGALVQGIIQNLPAIIDAVFQVVDIILSNLSGENLGLIIQAAFTIIQKIAESFIENAPTVVSSMKEVILSLVKYLAGDGLSDLIDMGIELVKGLAEGLMDSLDAVLDAMFEILEAVIEFLTGDGLPALLEKGMELIMSLIEGFVKRLPDVVNAITDIIKAVVDFLAGDGLMNLLEMGIELIFALAQGIIENLPAVIEAVMTLIVETVAYILENLPQFIEMGLQLIASLITGIIQAIPQIIAALPQVISAIFDAFRNVNWAELGINLIQGIISGIGQTVQMLWDAAVNAAKAALNAIKNLLGIRSPSRVFRDQIGKMIPEGMAIGIEANTDAVEDAMDNLSDLTTDPFGGGSNIVSFPGTGGGLASLGGVVINVYPSEGQDEEAIAEYVIDKLNLEYERAERAFA